MVLQATPIAADGPAAFRYEEKKDFTGGLNLRADQFNLEFNESPALLNVDVDPRGGVRRRDAVKFITADPVTSGDDEIISLFTHYEYGDNEIIAAALDPSTSQSQLYINADASGNFSLITGGTNVFYNTSQPPRGTTYNGFTFISNGELIHDASGVTTYSAVAWNGTTGTLLTPDIDDSTGHFPAARYSAVYADRVFVAYTKESGVAYPNRVRFSAASDGTKWKNTDSFEIDTGEDGDYITGIVSDGTRILIFKQNSVYELIGSTSSTFQVRNITRSAGNRDGCKPITGAGGVFFWYAEDGVFFIRDYDVNWIFSRIRPSMTYDVGQPALSLDNPPSMMWFDEKLWLSVDYQSDDNLSGSNQDGRRNTFMWDPSLGEAGAWTRYDINARELLAYRPSGGTHFGIAVTSGILAAAKFDRISKVDQNFDVDDYGTGSAVEIVSYYQTGWFEGNRPTFTKRWGKTRTVLLADNNISINLYVYKDYDLSGWVLSQPATITGLGSDATWDSAPSGDGDGVWDTSEWASEGTQDRYVFARWPTAGTAKAISLRFTVVPSSSYRGKWGVTSIIGMYRTRRLR